MSQAYRKSFRLVCPPERIAAVEGLLAAEGFVFEPEPFSPFCRALLEGPKPLGASLAAFFGLIYLQDRSSMLPPLALDPPPGAGVLDMCASPGSKTGFLAQLTGPAGFVIANEPTASRLAVLRRNMHTLNLAHTLCVSAQGQHLPFAGNSFDYIQLDPPCSGWGTDKKHPGIKDLWKGEKIQPLIALQRLLLAGSAALLRPGGRLVYSTCTTNRAENEEQLAYALERLDLELMPLPRFAGFEYDEPHLGLGQALRINGESSGAQGFFIACLGRSGREDKEDGGPAGARPGRAGAASRRAAACGRGEEGPAGLDEISPGCFAGSVFDLARLPRGRLFARGGASFFAHEEALSLLPPRLEWHGFLIGRHKNGIGRVSARMRALLPDEPGPDAMDFDDIEPLKRLLAGQSVSCGLPGGEAGLYWRGLPLGAAQVKSGRLIWNAR